MFTINTCKRPNTKLNLIHDDASTDNTVKVIEQLIPTKSKNIKKIYSEINKFSQVKPKSPELITNHVTESFLQLLMVMTTGKVIITV